MNYQSDVAILTDLCKKTAERSIDKELKKVKNSLKNQEMRANFELETHFQAPQNTVVSLSEVYSSA